MQSITMAPKIAQSAAATAPSVSEDSPRAQKLLRSSQEFEALMVSRWWQQMQQTFTDPGDDSDPGSETMQGMGIQAMAMGMAKSGGIGLARMMYHQLLPALADGQAKEGPGRP